jgi:hypothetical protein
MYSTASAKPQKVDAITQRQLFLEKMKKDEKDEKR